VTDRRMETLKRMTSKKMRGTLKRMRRRRTA
jgi:hypothetical protein